MRRVIKESLKEERRQARRINTDVDRFTPFPDEIKQSVFRNLGARDLAGSVNRVSKDFQNQTEDDNLWRTKSLENGIEKAETDTSWKQAYKANIKLPEILRNLRLALSKDAFMTSSHTSNAVREILQMINEGRSARYVYDVISKSKMISEPGASEGTIRNTQFIGGRISLMAIYNYILAADILKKDREKMGMDDFILAAAELQIPALYSVQNDANGDKVLGIISPTDPALLGIKAHKEYENAVRDFIRVYKEENNITHSNLR